jgi:putative membrane protein insertion efficiency factor
MRHGLRLVGAPIRVFVLLLLKAYGSLVSPLLGQRCRFHPSCSAYAMEAVQSHGVVKGLVLGAWRVGRCSPLSAGGPDPVPARGRWRSDRESDPTPVYDGVIRSA